jgi:hypothetical protein
LSQPSEPHPLDQDWDDDSPESRPKLKIKAYRPLLRASVILAIVCAVVILVSTIGTLNATPNSLFEDVTAGIHLAARWVLLLACCGILIAFQIPTEKRTKKISMPTRRMGGFALLLLLNLIGCAAITGLIQIMTLGLGFLGFVLPVFLLFFAGWLAVAAVWHKGYLRAYALGTLTAMLFELNGGAGLMLASLFAGPGRRGMNGTFWISSAACLPLLTGVLCSVYVIILERYRRDASRMNPSLTPLASLDELD